MRYNELLLQIQNAKPLDFGTILDQVIDLFKKVWLKGFLMVLLIMLLVFVASFLFGLMGLGSEVLVSDWDEILDFWIYSNSNVLATLPQTIVATTITIGLLSGFYRICKSVDQNNSQDEDDLFYFFKGQYFKKVLFLGIIYSLIATIAQSMFFIPYIYAIVPLSFFTVFFAFNPALTELEIVKLSFNLGTKKWFPTFGLLLLTGIIGMLGLVACGVGVLFTISIAYLPIYFIYKNVFGFSGKSEIDEIGLLQE